MLSWIVEAVSESGDDYGEIGRFDHEPTKEDLDKITHYDVIGSDGWSAEDRRGPGYNGSWLHLEIFKGS